MMLFSSGIPNPHNDPPISRGRDNSSELDQLRFDVERLLMISEAMWNILKNKHGYSDEDLIREITVIDYQDGKVDGKVAAQPPKPCPKCKRNLVKNRPRCIYCGEMVAVNPFQR